MVNVLLYISFSWRFYPKRLTVSASTMRVQTQNNRNQESTILFKKAKLQSAIVFFVCVFFVCGGRCVDFLLSWCHWGARSAFPLEVRSYSPCHTAQFVGWNKTSADNSPPSHYKKTDGAPPPQTASTSPHSQTYTKDHLFSLFWINHLTFLCVNIWAQNDINKKKD